MHTPPTPCFLVCHRNSRRHQSPPKPSPRVGGFVHQLQGPQEACEGCRRRISQWGAGRFSRWELHTMNGMKGESCPEGHTFPDLDPRVQDT